MSNEMIDVRFGEFELDEARFELRRAGVPQQVQPKVLDLLLYLVRHRDRVVKKEELFQHVWPDVAVSEGSLSQAISVARKVLGDTSDAQEHIRTVRGRGFQFVAKLEGVPRAALVTTATLQRETVETHGSSPVDTPYLFVLRHQGDTTGATSYELTNLDEVEIVRGKTLSAEHITEEITRRLVLSLPGEALSRVHARLVRVLNTWHAVDADSKNGTFLNGNRIRRQLLKDGDILECGHTYLMFREGLP
jgi:DNA-binding winged helix-turn-helix (wHTH) protein